MTPDQLAKSGSEHAHQVAFFAWCAFAKNFGFIAAWLWADGKLEGVVSKPENVVPALEWIHAIPNGGTRGDDEKSRAVRGGALKAEGVRQGVADIFLPWPLYERIITETDMEMTVAKWCGLYIEMKKPSLKPKKEGSKGGVSDEQKDFGEYAKSNGYGWIVCYSWREAAKAVQSYIEWGTE